VVADLLAVKVIRSFRLLPLRFFGGAGLLSALGAFLFLALSLRTHAEGGEPTVILAGVGILALVLSVFLIMLGLLVQSAVALSGHSRTQRTPLAREIRP
jgi:hypothetical protein